MKQVLVKCFVTGLAVALWVGGGGMMYRWGFQRGFSEDECRFAPNVLSIRLSLHEMALILQRHDKKTPPVGWSVENTWIMVRASVDFFKAHERELMSRKIENPQYWRDLEKARKIVEQTPFPETKVRNQGIGP